MLRDASKVLITSRSARRRETIKFAGARAIAEVAAVGSISVLMLTEPGLSLYPTFASLVGSAATSDSLITMLFWMWTIQPSVSVSLPWSSIVTLALLTYCPTLPPTT
jgi:hypothetical protein